MKLSDLIAALQYLRALHGDLPVLERRQVWYDGVTELFKDGIELDKKVLLVAGYHDGETHHYEPADKVPADAKDRREFKALVLGEIA